MENKDPLKKAEPTGFAEEFSDDELDGVSGGIVNPIITNRHILKMNVNASVNVSENVPVNVSKNVPKNVLVDIPNISENIPEVMVTSSSPIIRLNTKNLSSIDTNIQGILKK